MRRQTESGDLRLCVGTTSPFAVAQCYRDLDWTSCTLAYRFMLRDVLATESRGAGWRRDDC